MQDVRDWCQRNKTVPGPDTPLDRMKAIVCKEQAGDIGIWGKVERVPGFDTDVYDLWINVADFSVQAPRMIYTKKARTKTVSEIPHVYIKEALDRLYGRSRKQPRASRPRLARRWAKRPNLVKGDFETGRGARRAGTHSAKGVTWVREEGKKPAEPHHPLHPERGRGRLDGGALLQRVLPGGGGGHVPLPVPLATHRARRPKCSSSATTTSRPTPRRPHRREVYRSQQNLQGQPNVWNVHTEDFTPKHTQYTPHWGRVMLYAYWPAGTVDWDDIVVKQVAPAPAGKGEKDQRPSLNTKVRTKDLK